MLGDFCLPGQESAFAGRYEGFLALLQLLQAAMDLDKRRRRYSDGLYILRDHERRVVSGEVLCCGDLDPIVRYRMFCFDFDQVLR